MKVILVDSRGVSVFSCKKARLTTTKDIPPHKEGVLTMEEVVHEYDGYNDELPEKWRKDETG